MTLNVAIKKCEHFDDIDSIDVNVAFAKKIDEETNEQLNATISIRFDVKFRVINIVAIFVCFDVISSVAIERCEFFDDIDSDIDAEQNIDFDVAKKIDETSETMIVDFFLILQVNSDVMKRRFELISDF